MSKLDLCFSCEVKPATNVCVSSDLFGIECVTRRCDDHICRCAKGERMSIDEYIKKKLEAS